MSHLLKRTKKSCLKIFRKISSSKQLFAKRSDNDVQDVDDATNNNNSSYNKNKNNRNNHNQKANNQVNIKLEDKPTDIAKSPISNEKVNPDFQQSTESLPSITTTTTTTLKTTTTTTTTARSRTYPQNEKQLQTSPKKCARGKSQSESFDFEEESPNNTILHKLTARLFLTADGYDFHRLQHLRSDTGSEVMQFDVDAPDFQSEEEKIVFEKVKYKNDIRYFRHTPSNSSLDNYRRPTRIAPTSEHSYECGAALDVAAPDWLPPDDDDDEANRPAAAAAAAASNQFTNYGFQHQAPKETFTPMVNMSLGSKWNGNRQNVVISHELGNNNKLMPIVKWDINGNSLDDDDDLLPHEYLEDFDKRLSKRLAAVQQFQPPADDNESSESSLRSSSTTLETWVDEDLIVESPHESNFDLTLKENRCLIKA